MQKEIQKILNKKELKVIKKLNTPARIQDFLDALLFNFEERGETYRSPREMLKIKNADCFEGALFAHLCLFYHGYKSFLVDLKVKNLKKDSDHTLCAFKANKFWGAISKTNHSVLRWRDPIYKNTRELALSYFHEYFLDTGEKTLHSYSRPFDVFKKFGLKWIVEKKDLDELAEGLDKSPHFLFVPKENKRYIRKAGRTEIKGAAIMEWTNDNKASRITA